MKTAFESIKPIRNNIAHGAYYESVDLVLIEGRDLLGHGGSKSINNKKYNLLLNDLLMSHFGYMYLNEKALNNLLYHLFKQLNTVRVCVEKEL